MSGREPGGLALLDLAHWRALTSELYGEVRRSSDADAAKAWDVYRNRRSEMFKAHPQSPLEPEKRLSFSQLPCFPYDPSLRFHLPIKPREEGKAVSPRTLELAEGRMSFRPFASVEIPGKALGGNPATLTLYWIDGYGGGLFLPFKDLTNGESTFGGGRYLYDTIKGADLGASHDEILLDFNFSYNPSCAYSPRWICPLAPRENSLPARIEAGELAFEMDNAAGYHYY
jgi:uncharacterized protein (DUF1684 family)